MRKTLSRSYARLLSSLCVLIILVSSLIATPAVPPVQKMKAEEVVAKHLESLGSAAARSDGKGRVAVGTSRASFKARSSSGSIDGRAVLASVNEKALLAMAFQSPNYIGEKFGFDGKKFTIGYLKPGIRSPLGNFMRQHEDIFKEGLMGGTLLSTWPLLNLQERGAKLEYSGTEKIGEQLAHKLSYKGKGSSDLNITLYFDTKTFEHVRTLYTRVIASQLAGGGIDNQARQTETRYKMIEDFSDYKKEGELNLPHSYTLQLEINKTNGSSMDRWENVLTEFMFNQDIDAKGFDVEAN